MQSTTSRLALLLPLLAPLASATISFNSSFQLSDMSLQFSIPSTFDISSTCLEAYAAEISCSDWLIKGLDQDTDEDDKFSNTTLTELCTDQCWDSLKSWRDEVQKTCSKDEVIKANETMYTEQNYSEGIVILASVMTDIPILEYLYWPTCLKDTNTGELCASIETDTTDMSDYSDVQAGDSEEMIAGFCNNSCIVQSSVLTWKIYTSVYGDSVGDINVANAMELCPDLDTSTIPFLDATDSSSSSSSSSGSSSSGNGTTTSGSKSGTATNGTNTTAPSDTNAAGSLKAGVWGVGSTVLAVVVGLAML